MAHPQSPTRFNGYEDDPMFIEANFTQDISDRMRVPKRIKATGEYSNDDHHHLSNQNGIMNSWNYSDKIDMNVPDRIVVLGQDQHMGTRSAPREIDLENSILPTDPGFIRVATPPRIITLNEHHFPSASDELEFSQTHSGDLPSYIRANARAKENFNEHLSHDSDVEHRVPSNGTRKAINLNDSQLTHRTREETPPLSITDVMNPSDEVLHLRRQLAKLNRRILTIEIDNVQRQQREKIVCCLGLAYFLLKAIYWLNRN